MTIAIVGNGKLSKKYGNRINKHNIVIRFNHAKIQGYEKYVGNKTDILALVGATPAAYQNEASKIDNNILRDIGWIMFSGRERNENYEKLLLKKKSALCNNNANIIFQYVGYDCFIDLANKIKCEYDIENKLPSTGMNILMYILYSYNVFRSNIKVNVYGFDNFESGHYFDDERRNNNEFHPINAEKAIISYLKKNKNIRFFT